MGFGALRKTVVTQHSLPLNLEMQPGTLLCKEEAMHQFYAETMQSSLGVHVRWTETQWRHVLWSDESTFQLVF